MQIQFGSFVEVLRLSQRPGCWSPRPMNTYEHLANSSGNNTHQNDYFTILDERTTKSE